jgi:pyruvate kinase
MWRWGLNFSHGIASRAEGRADRDGAQGGEGRGKPICILADLQGPKIRTGKLVDHKPVLLVAGKRLTITPEQIEGTVERVSTVFTTLAENLKPGDADSAVGWLIELRVVEVPARTW